MNANAPYKTKTLGSKAIRVFVGTSVIYKRPRAAPITRIGRRKTVTLSMLEALCNHLLEKPGLYLDEMAVFLQDEFYTLVTTSSIWRALVSKALSKVWLLKLRKIESTWSLMLDCCGFDKEDVCG